MSDIKLIPISPDYRENYDRVFDRSHWEVPSFGEAYVHVVDHADGSLIVG